MVAPRLPSPPDGPHPDDTVPGVPTAEPTRAPWIAEVAVNAPLDRLFHYRIPEPLSGCLERGHRVLVPFGPRTTTGVCVGFAETSDRKLKSIHEIPQPPCRFDEHVLELTQWIAQYYHASWGEVLEAALPPGVRNARRPRRVQRIRPTRSAEALAEEATRQKPRARARARLLEYLAAHPGPHPLNQLLREVRVSRPALAQLREGGWVEVFEDKDAAAWPELDDGALIDVERQATSPLSSLELRPEQERAIEIIGEALEGRHGTPPPPILLHGVTGSGKTEIYLRSLARVLREGGRGLVLVPEISLTPQTVSRFEENLPGVRIAVLHSMLSSSERASQWREIQAGRVGVVIGARSAVFSPIPDLGLIVVDEEHEPSYKQESSPRYNGRDVAILRAFLLKIPVVLGTATPSLESYQHARTGKYRLVELPRRATPHDLPHISIISLGKEFYRPDGSGLLCGPLDHQLRKCLSRGEQAMLFLNRRGFATFVHCLQCRHVLHCQRCDITLTYHRRADSLQCHYCDSRYPMPAECPECHFNVLRRSGVGTEKIAELVERRFQGARVERLDRDVIRNHESLRSILERFSRRDFDVLVGTQMLAKGHDFPGVSLVGIISADTGLHFPDFRAAERTFQIITQVAGRAGRGDRAGRVVLQTFFPDHYAIRCAVDNDYRRLFETECEHRQQLGYPPFGRLAKVLVQEATEERTEKNAQELAGRLLEASAGEPGITILGPAPAPITRIQERHRFQILVKSPTVHQLQSTLRAANVHAGGKMTANVAVDIDPQSML